MKSVEMSLDTARKSACATRRAVAIPRPATDLR
jgi:hypothetical protein